ncbi:DnaD domain-containing protein [Caldalkalibacillus salinus]|uniref:DnaD domain-containing protein n=1 Tax=Caldalkalibacillus salinus TaxID=2803787 RepID=UPI001920FF2C|nr:DnaD domain-containing protein [Caldalkalibacillus salinus]
MSIQQWAAWMSKGSASIPYVLLQHYKKLSITDAELLLLIHIHAFRTEGVPFPSLDQLEERMTCTTEQLTSMLNRLRKDKIINIESSVDEQGYLIESYSLQPLWERLINVLTDTPDSVMEDEVASTSETMHWPVDHEALEDQKKLEGEIFHRFEQEFGRPLSPIECETIGLWLDDDKHEPQIIFLALREAVIANKLSFRYIDRILMEWRKKGVKTPEQVKEHSRKFRQQQELTPRMNESTPEEAFTFYNWLEK